jgi:predicted metal-binding membrane protein
LGRTTELRLTATLLIAAAAVAWVVTVNRMTGMDMGPGTDLGGLGWFAGVWAVMMAAMMLPSLAPMAGTYAREGTVRSSNGGAEPAVGTTLFVAGYLLMWTIVGVAAWTVFSVVRDIDPSFLRWDDGGRYVAAGVIVAASLYELTPLKAGCLRHCRDRGLLVADWHSGAPGALRMGLEQGAYCIGSSWALMAALFSLGVMSITWMVVIAALIAIEKILPRARLASLGAAALLLVLAAGVAFFPEQLPGLTVPAMSDSMGHSMSPSMGDSMSP